MEIYGFLPLISDKECPHCRGEGGWIQEDLDPNSDTPPLWCDCPICEGTGCIHVQPCSNEEEVNHDCI